MFWSHFGYLYVKCGLPWWLSGLESACQCRRHRFEPWVTKIPWRRKWQPSPAFLPGKYQRQRNLVGCSPWGGKKLDITYSLNNTNNVNCSHQSSPNTNVLFRLTPMVKGASLVAQTIKVKNLPAMRRTWVWSLNWEDPFGEGNGYLLQYSCPENPMDCSSPGWPVHGVTKSQTRLSN